LLMLPQIFVELEQIEEHAASTLQPNHPGCCDSIT